MTNQNSQGPTASARERLKDIIWEYADAYTDELLDKAADAIMREFALRPVAQGVVDSESGEVAEVWTYHAKPLSEAKTADLWNLTRTPSGYFSPDPFKEMKARMALHDELAKRVNGDHSSPSATETPAPPQPGPRR